MQWPSSMRDNIRKHFSIRLLTLAAAVSEAALSSFSSKNGVRQKKHRSLWILDTFYFYTLYHYSNTKLKTDKQMWFS